VSWAIWVTGPPGSGKTVIAQGAAALLHARGESARVLELDAIRTRLIPQPEYSEAERELVYRALGYMAARLTEAAVPVIVDATAHRRRWRDLARAAIERFAEVQLQCPFDVCRERMRAAGHAPPDAYARAGRPGATIPGVDVPYEPALAPELALNTTRDDVAAAAAAVASLAERLAAGAPGGRESGRRWAIWITGRPGSGKTTLARQVAEVLTASGVPLKVLDLVSARRAIVGHEWATDAQEAFVHRTLALTTQLLTEAGVAVILDATAPRRSWREIAREWIAHFAEVQLVCPPEICAERERAVRWHLGAAGSGDAGQVMAMPDIALGYEESLHPDLRLHTHVPNPTTSVEEVLRLTRRLEEAATSRSTEKERNIT
jgi:adenylylsulfate kinase